MAMLPCADDPATKRTSPGPPLVFSLPLDCTHPVSVATIEIISDTQCRRDPRPVWFPWLRVIRSLCRTDVKRGENGVDAEDQAVALAARSRPSDMVSRSCTLRRPFPYSV
jgi:hypothetical protein